MNNVWHWATHRRIFVASVAYGILTTAVVYESAITEKYRNARAVAYYADRECRDVEEHPVASLCKFSTLTVNKSWSLYPIPGTTPENATRVYKASLEDPLHKRYNVTLYDGHSYDGDPAHDAEPVLLETRNLATGSRIKGQIFDQYVTLLRTKAGDVTTRDMPNKEPKTAGPQESLIGMGAVYLAVLMFVKSRMPARRLQD